MNKKTIKRGDMYYAELNPAVGSEQDGKRPVLICSNDLGNKYSPTVVVVPLTGNIMKRQLPTHVVIPKTNGLEHDSLALAEQIRTLDRSRLRCYIGHISKEQQSDIDMALAVCVGIEKSILDKGCG
jgi:mRNA interferase MazF